MGKPPDGAGGLCVRAVHHPPVVIRHLGLQDYDTAWQAMRDFVEHRDNATPDELRLLEHPPVYTRGLNCRLTPLRPTTIPVIQSDRGGQITYHGPGQAIVYAMLDIRRRQLGIRQLVRMLEQAVMDLLKGYGIDARRRIGAPGVYVDDRKIAALGIRIRHGYSYHGLSLNVDMDLAPFHVIHPCGYEGLEVTQLRDLGVDEQPACVADRLAGRLLMLLDAVAAARPGALT